MNTQISARLAALAGVSSIAMAMLSVSGAAAQAPVVTDENESYANDQDTIYVTARRKQETLEDTPLSIDAFDSEALQELGAKDISELSSFTPGFTMEKFGGRRGAEGDTSRPVIRGQANVLGETNAAVFVDGVPYSGSFLSFPFAAIERIEVVKGPQAALFGRSTFAGAINVITKKGTNTFENNVTATVASQDEYEVNASTSGPLVEDKLFYFLHGRYYDYGGEYENTIDGSTVGKESSWGFNGSLEYHPTDDIVLTLRGGYNEDDDNHSAQVLQNRLYNNCFLDQARQYYCGEIEPADEVTVNIPALMGEDGLRRETSRISASGEWDIMGSGYTFSANAGWTGVDEEYGNDQTYGGDPLNFAGGTFRRLAEIDRDEWSAEARIDTPAEHDFRASVGYFMYNRDMRRFRRFPGTETIFADFGNSYTENWAIFGSAEYDITSKLTARAEVRYQEDTIGNDAASGDKFETTFDTITPRFVVDYDLTPDMMFYATVAKGNKPGYINADPTLPVDLQFADEEEAWSYEAGAKMAFFDRRLKTSLAVYFIDWTDQQLTQSVFVGGVPTSVVTNAGTTEVTGLEFEGQWQITDAFDVSVGYAYTDAEIQNFCDPIQGSELTGFDCVNDDGIQGGQTAGNILPNSPKHHLVLSSEYTKPVPDTNYDWFVRGDFSHTSRKYAQVHNLAYVGDRDLLNFKAGLREAEGWSFTLFVDNVLDDRTPSTVIRFADLTSYNVTPNENPALDNVPGTTSIERAFLYPLAQSRQYGITISYDF